MLKYNKITIKSSDILMFFIIFVFFLLFSLIGWSRHYGFMTSINDMGHYDQAIWGIINKGFFLNTSLFNTPINKLGFHFDPVLYLFAPLYCLKPTVNWLIFAQAIALSVSAWPIYRLACHYTPTGATGIFWGLTYLINPFVLNAASWDFHPLTLAVPWIAGACLAVERQRFSWLLACCLFVLLCKEHFGLMVAGFGLLWAIRHRGIWKSLSLTALGACHFILVLHYVMPALSPTSAHLMMSNQLGQLSRYSWLGNTLPDIAVTLLHHPLKVMYSALFEFGGFLYLGLLLLPFLWLPLLGLPLLIPASGDLLANLLSANPLPRGVFSYHSAAILPLFCAAAIRGSQSTPVLTRFLSSQQLAGIVFLISLIYGYVATSLPLPCSCNIWGPKNLFSWKDSQLPIIDPEASLSVQANVAAHFSQREEIFAFPNKVGEVDAIILRLDSPTTRMQPMNPKFPGTLASHLQMEPGKYLQKISSLLENSHYGIAMWQDPWLVMKQGKPDCCQRVLVERKIIELNAAWKEK
jgi:uncharacterized membrane protein